MPPMPKHRERAERYRQIARNTFNPKIAREIEKIAEDYEDRVTGEERVAERAGNNR